MKNLLTVIIFFFTLQSMAQIGGTHTYSFLDLINSARAASLGGDVIALNDNDLNLTYHNPALLNTEMNQDIVLNYINYFTDINYGYAAYATSLNEKGIITGEFKAAEYAINLIYSRPIDSSFYFGVNVKPVISTLEKYTSLGIDADFG